MGAAILASATTPLGPPADPPGSAGGPDGLRPQHLKDMTDRLVGGDAQLFTDSLCQLHPLGEDATLGTPCVLWGKPLCFQQEGQTERGEADSGRGHSLETCCHGGLSQLGGPVRQRLCSTSAGGGGKGRGRSSRPCSQALLGQHALHSCVCET